MSNFVIKLASKKAKKMRIGISAPSGHGKTYSALLLAKGICDDWTKICVIDSERDSSMLYADLGKYSTLNLEAPFTPEKYIEAITAVEQAGFAVIIVDSITHEWAGNGGCLEIHATLGGRFQDWSRVTPRHNAFIDKILTSSCHVITTVRKKQEYAIDNSSGKAKVEKLGLGEVTRDGFEYELDLSFDITNDKHIAKTGKDRTGLFSNQPEFVITEATGELIKKWADNGVPVIEDALTNVRNTKTLKELLNVFNEYEKLVGSDQDFKDALAKRKQDFKDIEASK